MSKKVKRQSQKIDWDNYLHTQSMNDLWLLFYMKEKKGKIWNEGKGKWLD